MGYFATLYGRPSGDPCAREAVAAENPVRVVPVSPPTYASFVHAYQTCAHGQLIVVHANGTDVGTVDMGIVDMDVLCSTVVDIHLASSLVVPAEIAPSS